MEVTIPFFDFLIDSTRGDLIYDFLCATRAVQRNGNDAWLAPHCLTLDISDRNAFVSVPLWSPNPPEKTDELVLLGAHLLSEARVLQRRPAWREWSGPVTATGHFGPNQHAAHCQTKLERMLDRPVSLTNLGGTSSTNASFPVSPIQQTYLPNRPSEKPAFALFGFPINDDMKCEQLISMQHAGDFRPIIVCSGKDKENWIERHGIGIPIFHYSELDAKWMMKNLFGLAFFINAPNGVELQTGIESFAKDNRPIVDCTVGQKNSKVDQRFVAGPPDLHWLNSFLSQCGTEVSNPKPRKTRLKGPKKGPLFIPTNGVGLGHAQRLSLVADQLSPRQPAPKFAAFPSCIPRIRSLGYNCTPLVSRSSAHKSTNANDIFNNMRVLDLARSSSGIVFDGGYPFDSIIRSSIEADVPSIWFRRGMLPEGRSRQIALAREIYFDHIVVPTEAFSDLNEQYSDGAHITEVGPICHKLSKSKDRKTQTRAAIARKFDREFDTLIVSMLGGGVASDRLAQLLAIAIAAEQDKGTLHLVVTWPNAVIDPALDSWINTHVVQTSYATVLADAADIRVSACGYNTFHEALYNQWDMIYIPQIASYMDDQLKRAEAAQNKNVAQVVMPESLHQLTQLIESRISDGGATENDAFARLKLPKLGNRAAAKIIEEVMQ